ncbi:MAG TPA: hypothetical protein VFI78_07160 [Salinimicrobium sp.]|nr:hypothetical protein [Salinimicrobium sp.]
MKTKALFIVFFFGCFTSALAQNLNTYQYVQVPEKYEYQDEANEYQLNALTAFLFEKYGFNALYKEEVPEGTDPCRMLQADVLNESNIFRTKVKLILKDCYNKVVFASEGKSKFKDYKRSFHDALRNAFSAINELDYKYEAAAEEQGEVVFNIKTVPSVNSEKAGNAEKIEKKPNPSEAKNKIADTEKGAASEKIEKNKSSKNTGSQKFINGNTEYRLEKTASGYVLYKAGEEGKFATLMKSGAGKNFIYSSENVQGAAYFDDAGNLVVEYISEQSGQLVSLKYKAKAK